MLISAPPPLAPSTGANARLTATGPRATWRPTTAVPVFDCMTSLGDARETPAPHDEPASPPACPSRPLWTRRDSGIGARSAPSPARHRRSGLALRDRLRPTALWGDRMATSG